MNRLSNADRSRVVACLVEGKIGEFKINAPVFVTTEGKFNVGLDERLKEIAQE
jgi:hypothetical protein